MSASKTSTTSSQYLADVKKITLKHYLLLFQLAFMIVIWVYWAQIDKGFKEEENQIKSSSINSALNGVVAANPQNLCITYFNVEDYKKIRLYTRITLIFINLSPLLNSFYLAFQYKFPPDRWIVALAYAVLGGVGIVGMALSVDGFLKIRSMTTTPTLPSGCASFSQKLKTFFILSMSINVMQAVVSMWILKELYYVAK